MRDPRQVERLVRDADRVAPHDLPARASAPASPTRPSSARSPHVGLEHGWLRGYLLYLDDEPDRVLALLALRRHDADPDRAASTTRTRAPRRHLPAHARDRGRLRRPRAPRARLRPGRRGLQAAVLEREPRGAERRSSSRRASAASASTRPGRRSSAPRGSPARALDATRLTDRVKSRWRNRVRTDRRREPPPHDPPGADDRAQRRSATSATAASSAARSGRGTRTSAPTTSATPSTTSSKRLFAGVEVGPTT